jgi:hypothetical protein
MNGSVAVLKPQNSAKWHVYKKTIILLAVFIRNLRPRVKIFSESKKASAL